MPKFGVSGCFVLVSCVLFVVGFGVLVFFFLFCCI